MASNDFVAIDVETANAAFASICQVGLAVFHNGELVEEWCSYVDPLDEFDDLNTALHGIDEATVAGAPTWPDIAARVSRFLSDRVCVSHTHFDRTALHQVCDKYGLCPPAGIWLDSACVARRAWREFARSGYGLANVCKHLQYEYQAHDALADAKAAAHVLQAAMLRTGLTLEGWLKRVREPIDRSGLKLERTVNPDGPLLGEIIVFTGTLTLPRARAADLAAHAGCEIADNVTRKTTILVVGDQDARKLAGHEKSTKHRKAEALIAAGQPLHIWRESDFVRLIEIAA